MGIKRKDIVQENTKKDETNKESFFEKMKTDKKYKAKVEIIGYGVFIVVLILYLNIANMGSSIPSNTVSTGNSNTNTDLENSNLDLFKELKDNYQYDVEVVVKMNNVENTDDSLDEQKIHYSGKVFSNNMEINQEYNGESSTYYKVDDFYYQRLSTEEEFGLVEVSTIYPLIDSKYIEIAEVKKLIDTASLDHVTNYSSGKKETIYHLMVKDVIRSYQDDDVVEISIVIENDTVTMTIDYSLLMKVINEKIEECQVKFIYTNIGTISEFQVMEEEKVADSNS